MGVAQGDVTINNIHVLPKINDQFVVCNKTNTVCIMNTQGQVLNIVTLTKFSKYVLMITERSIYSNIIAIISNTY